MSDSVDVNSREAAYFTRALSAESRAEHAEAALNQAEEREGELDNALAALHAEIARLQGERDKAIAQVRVAYGFDRDAVFANIDALTAQVAALRKALELYEAELRDVAEVIGERMNGDTHSDDANWSIELSAGHWRCLEAYLRAALASAGEKSSSNREPQTASEERDNDLLRRGDIIAMLHRLAENHADLALYGEEANAREREAMEAAFTHARCAVALMPTRTAPAEARSATSEVSRG